MFSKRKEKAKISIFVLLLLVLNILSIQPALALNGGAGTKTFNFEGYRYIDANDIEIWLDKNTPSISVSQVKIFQGSESTGTPLQIQSVGSSSGSNITGVSGLPGGASFLITTQDNFVPDKLYTVVLSRTITAKNGAMLGSNGDQDVAFSFTAPDTAASPNGNGTYSASAQGSLNIFPQNNANNVPLENNIGFSVNIPVANYAAVLSGLVLEKQVVNNGVTSEVPLTLDPTIDSTQDGDIYAPIVTDDHTLFFFPMTGGGSSYSYNLAPNTVYTLSIPAITLVNNQTIAAQTVTFTTTANDTPSMVSPAPTAANSADGSNLTISWTAAAGAAGYNVYASTDPYWNYVKLNDSPITGLSYTTSGLNPNTAYYFRVASVNGVEALFSNYVTATTPAAAPTFVSAATNAEGTVVTATFSKAMMATLPAAPAGFTVTAGGTEDVVTSVYSDTDPTKIDLTLTTPVTTGQAVTLAYTAGTVTSADAGVLASFSGQSVTNNVSASINAPTLVSAKTYGGPVIVTFSKTMATLPAAPAGFSVTVNGADDPITAVSVNNTMVYLTLTTPITAPQVATVAYTAGSVTATDNTVLSSFTVQPVTNLVSPLLVSATTDTTGSNVTLTYNAAMAPPPPPAGFAITVNGVSDQINAVTLYAKNPAKYDFNLSTPISYGQTVLIGYSGTAQIQSATGGNAGSFATNAPTVINNVPPVAPTVSNAATSGPTHIQLNMTGFLRGTTADPTAFTVVGSNAKHNVTAAAVSGPNVILTLDTAITNGETITVNYAKTGNNNLTNGADVANFSESVANNLVTNATAPTFVSAATNLTGKVITATFNKAMSAAPAGITVSVDGVNDPVVATALNTDPTKFDLALTNPVINGQTVTLTYTGGTIAAADGGALAPFTTQPVSNNALANGYLATVAGSLKTPDSIAIDSMGNIYFADNSNYIVREVAAITHCQFGISMTAGSIYTVAGTGTLSNFQNSGDGSIATGANLSPSAIAVDSAGDLYISSNNRIRKVDTTGIITNFAGTVNGTMGENGSMGYAGDGGLAINALLNNPSSIAVDSSGNVYITDSGNNRIRKVDTSGIITTVVGNATSGYSGDGNLATSATLNNPRSVKLDGSGNIYFADYGNNVVREVAATIHSQFGISNMQAGDIYTIAGTGSASDSGNGSQANQATLNGPLSIEIDSAGNLYIGEIKGHYIRKVAPNGIISNVTGTGTSGYSPDNSLAANAMVGSPFSLAVDSTGNLYYCDFTNKIVRFVEMYAPATLSSIAVTTPATKLNYTVGDTLDLTGLVVTGTFSDGSTQAEQVIAANVTGFDNSKPATGQVLTITIDGKTTTYTVDIKAATTVQTNLANLKAQVPNNTVLVGKYLFQLSDTNGLTQANVLAAMATAPTQDIYFKSYNGKWYDLNATDAAHSVANVNDLLDASKAVDEASTIDSIQILKWFGTGASVQTY